LAWSWSAPSCTHLSAKERNRVCPQRQARAQVLRSPGLCRPQARSSNRAGCSFGFGCGKLWTPAFRSMRSRRRLPQKSGSPPLFELSLNVERNDAHKPNSRVSDPVPRYYRPQRSPCSKGPNGAVSYFRPQGLVCFSAGRMNKIEQRQNCRGCTLESSSPPSGNYRRQRV